MKKAFTMIELIFVIVIIGILSAIVIPKLSVTRDDAENTKACANIATCIVDVGAHYTATGSAFTSSEACTEVSSYVITTITGQIGVGTAGGAASDVSSICPDLAGITSFSISSMSL